jgi:hypothetical protein
MAIPSVYYGEFGIGKYASHCFVICSMITSVARFSLSKKEGEEPMSSNFHVLKSALLTSLTVAFLSCSAIANEIYSPVVSPIVPGIIDAVPDVNRVPGKEFTDSLDMTYVPTPHALSPAQLGRFDGQGGAENGLDLAFYAPPLADSNVDAQSQVRDRLFNPVRNNRVPLVVSTSFDQMLGSDVALAAERTGGAVESFATSPQIVNHAHAGGQLRDIDSVDLWGREQQPRAGFYSFQNEPGGVSIYTLQTIAVGFMTPYVTTGQIAGAIGNTALAPFIDVDGLMVNDIGSGPNPFDGQFGPGDSIIFSIEPIPNPEGGDFYDGGEIWVWDFGQPAEFLKHGDHLWNTAFDVQGTFGVNTENIDAIEAVSTPEPMTVPLCVVAGAALIACRRRR